jgi:3-phenylpropionate/cinnamic acid dioxygenase small subunit
MNVTVSQQQTIQAGARQLLADYTYVLDEGPLADWPAFFTETCLYRITTRQNEERNMPLSIMLCDNHAMLYDRVEAVEKANIFEPHYYRHVLSDSRLLRTTADSIVMETSFICVRTMLDGRMCLFAAGKYVDEIVIEGNRRLFRAKTVVLDSSQIDTLIAKPL